MILTCVLVIYLMTFTPTKGAQLNINKRLEDAEEVTMASLIGNEEIIPKELIRKIEEFLAPAMNVSTNELCRNHSEIYIQGLRNEEMWAYQILDSSAKLQSGMLTGNLVSLGNFDECIEVREIQTDFGQFNGKYCLATLTWENETFISTKDLFGNLRRPGMPKSVTLQWAFCIPSSCGAEDLVLGLQNVLWKDIRVTVGEMDCHTGDSADLRVIDYVAIVVFSLFGLLVILSTAYDILKKGKKKEILIAFSVVTNGKNLLKIDRSPDNLPCLHGMRFISIGWIVLGHRYMISTGGPAMNLTFALDFIKGAKSTTVVNSQLGVDTFFVMSGFLVSYVFLKQMSRSKDKSFNVFLYYLHRYVRLTPALAVLILLQVSLIDYLGSGPMWDKNNQFLTQLCKENWWSALLHIQNYVSGDRMCVGHSWYLSVDMQIIWLSPLLLLPLLRWPKRWNMILLGGIILAGIITSFVVNYVNEFPAGINAGKGPEWDAKNKYEYVKTHTRFTPWVIGFALGYIVYNNRGRVVRLNKLQLIAGWILANIGLLGAVNLVLPFQQPDYEYNVWESASYSCLYRPAWAFGVAWVIFLCVSGYGEPINTLLSWEAFQPLSRLTYCIYLVHFTFLIYRQFSIRTPGYLNDMNLVCIFLGDMIMSILLGAALSLVFESPAIVIEKILLKKYRGKPKCKTTSTSHETSVPVEEGGNINQGFNNQNSGNSNNNDNNNR